MFRVTRNGIVIAGMAAVTRTGMIIVGTKGTTARATIRIVAVITKALA
jgi:hypothetical protein